MQKFLFTIIYSIAHIFQTKINEGDLLQRRSKNPKTYFCAKVAPTIGIKQYLLHLIKHLGTPPATLILTMIYVERLLQSLTRALSASGSKNTYLLTSHNAHRIVMTAMLLAHKYSIDVAYPFSLLSKLVGVSPSELKILESEFLVFVKFELYVSQDLYSKYEEVFSNWPELPEEAPAEPEAEDMSVSNESRVMEERKEIDENHKAMRKPEDKQITDEDVAMSYIENDQPNPSNRHEKLVNCTPSSTIQNLDIRSLFYEDDPESDKGDEDTEMTLYGKFAPFLINF